MTDATKNLLVIEDDSMLVSAISKAMRGHGVEVVVISDGAEGLKTAFESRPDLILLDLVLPNLDGMAILKKLREDSWGKKVPIFILTNQTNVVTINKCNKLGVQDYLIKTELKISEVVEKIKQELGVV